jgi:hypothetical protein
MGRHNKEHRNQYRKRQKIRKKLGQRIPFKNYLCNAPLDIDPSSIQSEPLGQPRSVQQEQVNSFDLNSVDYLIDKNDTPNIEKCNSDDDSNTLPGEASLSSTNLTNLFDVPSRATTPDSARCFLKDEFQKNKTPISRRHLRRLCQSDPLYNGLNEYILIKSRYENIVQSKSLIENDK